MTEGSRFSAKLHAGELNSDNNSVSSGSKHEMDNKKETINAGIPANTPVLFPRRNNMSNDFDFKEGEEGKKLSQRLLNLTVATTSEQRSTTPVPPPRPAFLTELSPATLNKLRGCPNTGSITSSPCVTEITEVAGNISLTDSSLRLPTFANVCSNRESPSTSQVSVGSIPPTLTAALLPTMRKHYDLTPVMRNTSSSNIPEYIDAFDQAIGSERHTTITPSNDIDEDHEDGFYLHGEHLAMPSDLFSSSPSDPTLTQLQPIAMRIGPPEISFEPIEMSRHMDHSNLRSNLPPPIDFPTRKYYTFTSREQYEEIGSQCQQQDHTHHCSIKPYQPNRQADFDIERLRPEELNQIFIARRGSDGSALARSEGITDGVETDDLEVSRECHRFLQQSIPLDGRQWSIPSLRRGHILQGSTTSVTETTDLEDEDSLVYISSSIGQIVSNVPDANCGYPSNGVVEFHHGMDDNLSVSSKGSSLCHHEDLGEVGHFQRCFMTVRPPLGASSVEPGNDTDSVEAVAIGGENFPQNDNEYLTEISRRRKRKQQRQKEVYEWLQSVEVDQNVLAEAASSKFLTSGVNHDEHPQQYLHDQLVRPLQEGDNTSRTLRQLPSPSLPLHRQFSSPASLMT